MVTADQAHRLGGCGIVIARLFNVYGPGDPHRHLLSEVLRQTRRCAVLCLGDVDAVRDFVYVEDAADALVVLLRTAQSGVFNIGTGTPVVGRELVDIVADLTGRRLDIHLDRDRLRRQHRPVSCAVPDRLRIFLPWWPRTSLREGIQLTITADLGDITDECEGEGVMTAAPSLVFLLDTPNVWRGRALAGTPARVLALAEHGHRAGADVTLVLCDRGADYGTAADWPFDVLLVHPSDFYASGSLVRLIEPIPVDVLVICEAEALLAIGREATRLLGARLVYDVHDDAAVAASLGVPPEVVGRYETTQRTALRMADHVIVSTRNEADITATSGIASARTAFLPNGADPYQRTYWGPDIDAAMLVFLGNLYYQPNARAVATIRSTILPSLYDSGVDARVRVVGRGPIELTQSGDGIEFTGRVETINEALRGERPTA